MHFALLNESTVVTERECHAIVQALNIQAHHMAHPWDRLQPSCSFHKSTKELSPEYVRLTILDDPDQAGALGYHTVDPDGFPTAKIFARLLDYVLQTANSVSSCASHEFVEAWGNPTCLMWDTFDGKGQQVAHELGDPVQNDFYNIQTKSYGQVAVSNFLLPNYFNPWATDNFDYMGKLTRPAPALSKGGYAIVDVGSGEKQVFGDVPAWKRGLETNRTKALLTS